MKKLGQFALIGALTLGSFAATGLVSSPAKAATSVTAASPVADDWSVKTYADLLRGATYMPELAVGDLKHGDTFDTTIEIGGKEEAIVKLFYIHPNGELQRYKTIQGEDIGSHFVNRYQTPITTVYTPGLYTAVMKIGNSYYFGAQFRITQ